MKTFKINETITLSNSVKHNLRFLEGMHIPYYKRKNPLFGYKELCIDTTLSDSALPVTVSFPIDLATRWFGLDHLAVKVRHEETDGIAHMWEYADFDRVEEVLRHTYGLPTHSGGHDHATFYQLEGLSLKNRVSEVRYGCDLHELAICFDSRISPHCLPYDAYQRLRDALFQCAEQGGFYVHHMTVLRDMSVTMESQRLQILFETKNSTLHITPHGIVRMTNGKEWTPITCVIPLPAHQISLSYKNEEELMAHIQEYLASLSEDALSQEAVRLADADDTPRSCPMEGDAPTSYDI